VLLARAKISDRRRRSRRFSLRRIQLARLAWRRPTEIGFPPLLNIRAINISPRRERIIRTSDRRTCASESSPWV
jgi:hypothetical protein